MNFSLLKVNNPNKLKHLSKNKINFFKKEEDISLFHFNKFDNELYHAVFNVQDEYKVSTKKLGEQHNYVYSSLVNFFFLSGSSYAFVEYINKEYQEEVLNELMRRTRTKIELLKVNNELIKILYKDLDGIIKKINYTNEDGELLELDYVTEEKFNEIVYKNIVDDFTILFEGQFIKVSKEGRISVNNSDENYLINFTKRLINAID